MRKRGTEEGRQEVCVNRKFGARHIAWRQIVSNFTCSIHRLPRRFENADLSGTGRVLVCVCVRACVCVCVCVYSAQGVKAEEIASETFQLLPGM
jgi:hypothetical protein